MSAKLPPFLWISKAAVQRLHELFPSKGERSTALSIYTGLAFAASQQQRSDHQGFECSRARLARSAGVSTRTLDAYVARLEDGSLVSVTRRRSGKKNLPNLWSLVEPNTGGATVALPEAIAPGVVQPLSVGVAQPLHEGGAASDTPTEERGEKALQEITQDLPPSQQRAASCDDHVSAAAPGDPGEGKGDRDDPDVDDNDSVWRQVHDRIGQVIRDREGSI